MAIKDMITRFAGLWHANNIPGTEDVRDEVAALYEEIWDFTKAAVDSMVSDVTAAQFFAFIDRAADIISATYVPNGAAATNGTNFGTVVLNKHDGAGGAAVVVGSVDTSAVSMASGVPRPLALTAANVGLTAGQVLSFQITKAASGVALPAGKLVVVGRRK